MTGPSLLDFLTTAVRGLATALAKNLRTQDLPRNATAQYLRSGHRS